MTRQTVMGPGDYLRDEYPAGATDIEPGHLVEVNDGSVDPHGTADATALPAFAIEDRDVGKTPADTYVAADNENVPVAYPQRGGKVNLAWLAAGETVTEGDYLVSAGDGTLQAYASQDIVGDGTDTVDQNKVVAVADETLDNSGGASAVRLEVKSA